MCATSVTLRNAIDSLLTPRKCMRTTGPPGCIAPSTMLFVRSVNVCARPARPKSLLKITIRQDVRQCRKSGRSSETASPQAQTAPERKSYPGHATIGIGQARGSTHAHGCAKLKNDPGICHLAEKAATGWLAEQEPNSSNRVDAATQEERLCTAAVTPLLEILLLTHTLTSVKVVRKQARQHSSD